MKRFEEALSSTGVAKDINRWERSAEKDKEKKKEPAKDGAPSSKRENGGRREVDARALGRPTILQREAKQAPTRASQKAPPTDAISGDIVSEDTDPPPLRFADMVNEADEGPEAETEEHCCLQIREANALP